MKKRSLVAFIVSLLLSIHAAVMADTIKLKNGDALSGELLQIHSGQAILQTQYAGEVNIRTEEIAALKTSKPVYLELATGKPIIGHLGSSPDNKVRVVTKDGVKLFYPHDIFLLRALMPDEQDLAKFKKPMVWDHRLEVGGQVRTGNSSAQDANLIYGSQMVSENLLLTNALAAGVGWASGDRVTQQVLGESRLDWSHTRRFYSFYSFNGQHDLLKNLYLRAREEAGVGYKFIFTKNTLFQGDIGAGLLEDVLRYSANDIDPIGHAGILFTQKFNSGLEIGFKSVLLPDFSDFKHVLSESEAWFLTPLTERLFFKLSGLNRFDSKPPLGAKKNDLTLRTGIVIIF